VAEAGRWAALDPHIPPSLREQLEKSLWEPIKERSTLEVLREDPDFLANPGSHPAMFADHGVVHVRDVATNVVSLAESLNGLLLPQRPPERVAFMQTVGVAMAYLHDVGMVDMTHVGRSIHALYAAHAAFAPDVDGLVARLLSAGEVRDVLEAVEAADPFGVPVDVVVREILSLTVAHSKSTVEADAFADPTRLARLMRSIVFTSMAEHRAAAGGSVEDDLGALSSSRAVAHPSPSEAYAWLAASDGPKADLVGDVIDSVRVLRAADVLRQRGSSLRTSAGFEVFFDARTGRAVCTLRPADGRSAYLVTYDDQRGAGEANISMVVVTTRGDLRIAFHRGSFADDEAAAAAAGSVADAVVDIWDDLGPAFQAVRARGLTPPARSSADMMLQLERPNDAPAFAELVAQMVRRLRPDRAGSVEVVHDLASADPEERRRYEEGRPVDPGGSLADDILVSLAAHGTETSHVDRSAGFAEMRLARVAAGEVVVSVGSFPAFVYVPLGPGLTVHPVGGYPPAELHPWVPVGVTGAVRKAPRNGEIVADRDVRVLVIPSEEFVAVWLRPLEPQRLRERLGRLG
jgi:hypothetical protein